MEIMETIMGALSPTTINTVADRIGETPEATRRAMAGAVPALLGGMVHQGETTYGAVGLINMMHELPVVGGLTELLSGRNERLSRSGTSIVAQVFGRNVAGIANRIGSFAGMNANTAKGLMTIAAPMVLGGVAKAAPPGGYSPESLIGILETQKPSIAAALPEALTGLAGTVGLTGKGRTVTGAIGDAIDEGSDTVRNGMRWLPWVIGAIAIAAIALFGISTCSASGPSAFNTVTRPPPLDLGPIGALGTASLR